MSIAALLGLVDLSGTLVLDSNGKIVLLPEGAEMRPGDIELSPDNLVPDVELRETLFAQINSQAENSASDLEDFSANDLDADAIIAQIEAGADPTQNEDQATAAGGSLSSSITDAATVEAINPQVLAATFFETLGLDRQDLTETQTNALLDIATNSAPVTLFEARNYDEESQDSDLGLSFPTDTDGDALTVTVTELPKLGQVTLADGSPISLGQTLTQTEFENLQFDAPQEYTFGEDAGQFTYSVDDGQGQPDSVQTGGVLLEINPINDIPVIDEVGQGTLVESGNLDDGQVVEGVNTASGSISASDNDTDAVLTYGVENDTNEYGQLRVDPETGDWVFTLDNSSSATQSLKEGDSINTTFEVTVTDDKGAVTTETLTLTINGTNDLPTFDAGGDAAGTVTEQGDGIGSDNLASGTLSVTDVDADAILTFEIESEQNDFGSFSVDENGQWQFELDNDASVTQALSEGETETLNYTVSVTDEFGARSEQIVTITVIGTNDTPEIKDGRGTSGAVNEAGHLDDGTLFPGKVSDFGIIRAADSDGTLSFTTTDESDYGEFTINELTGEWRFTLDNNAAMTQSLKEGETVEVVFNVKVADEAGAFVMQPVTIEIFGANDQPTISSSSDLDCTVIESGDNTDGTSLASGTLVGEDVDDDTTFTFFVEEGASEYGQLVMKPNGEWMFEIDNDAAATQALNAGDSIDITYPVTIRDEFGAINTDVLTITVVGTNDLPQIVSGSSSALTEDVDTDALGYLVATDTLVISDKDADEETFNPGNAEPVGSTLGSLTIAADGTWTYSVDNSLTAVQALDVGDKLVEEFIVTSADGTEHTIAVTINGTEDETIITGPTTDTVKEDTDVDAGLLIAGDNLSLTITDNDAGENKFSTTVTSVANDNGQLPLGTLTITEDGDWSYQVSNALQEIQSLGDGDTRVERFTVTSIDGSKTETIEVTIQGTNDLPLIGGNAVGSVTEDFEVQTGDLLKDNGQLTIFDADTGEAKFQTVVTPVGSVLGTLTITETGAWSYEVDNANPTVQGLGEGDSLTETFQVLSEDGTPQNIVITINGVNDIPTIVSGDSVLAQEDVLVDGDGNIVATNTLVISDDDTGEEVFNAGAATSVGTTLGTLTIDAAGVWTYKVDNSLPQIQALDVGTSLTESFTVTSADGTEHQINVTVNGTEDPTIISNYQPGAVTEDTAGILTDSGSLSIVDLDAGEALFNTTVTKLNNGDGQSPLGNLTIDANGNWTYTVDNSLTGVQELGDGETREEVFQVSSIDGSVSQAIVVTITGVNGAPSIVSGESGAVTEDTAVTPSDTLVATDKLVIADEDAGENVFDAGTATPVGTTLGSLTITADGTWTYTLDNTLTAVQALDDGDKVIEEFNVTSADGTEHTIAVTINGTEDETFITGPTTDTVKEDTDVDAGLLIAGDNLSLTITDNDAGENKFSTTVTSVANDNGQLPLGTLTITEDGDWSYQVSNALQEIQSLGDGDTRVERFTVTSIDGSKTETIEVTIQGTNDLPLIGGNAVGSVTEDFEVQTGDLLKDNGQLTIFDADTGEAKFQTVVTPVGSVLGTLTITETGAWNYEVDNTNPTVQGLGEGDSLTETFQVLSEDGTPQNIVITINGVNDVPTITSGDSVIAQEDVLVDGDGNIVATNTLVISDDDTGEEVFNAGTATPVGTTLGTLTIDVTGVWTYKVDNSLPQIQALDVGTSLTESFTVTSADGTEHQIDVTVNGTEDPTIISNYQPGAVTEDTAGILTDSGSLSIADLDAGEALFYTTVTKLNNGDGQSPLGNLTIDANGNWTYTVDNSLTGVQELGDGITRDEVFQVTSIDGSVSQTIVVTITGVDGAPSIVSGESGAVTEDAVVAPSDTLVATDKLVITDEDAGENVFDAGAATPVGTTLGSLTIMADGTWTYTLDNTLTAVQALDDGDKVIEEFTVTSADGTEHTIAVTINGTEDETFITGPTTDTVTEDTDVDAGLLVAGDNLSLTITDNDAGENKFSTSVTSVANDNGQLPLGTLTITEDGDWSYQVSNAQQEIQSLGDGDTRVERFTVTSIDGSKTETIEVTIQGTNDLPLIGGNAVGSVTEDFEVQTGDLLKDNGQLTIFDADTGEAKFQTVVTPVGSVLGTLTITETGAWSYEVDNANPTVQGLGEGDSLTETFQVLSEDGTPQNIVITINGVNDIPTIVSGDSVLAQEDVLVDGDGNIVATNTLVISDDDTGEEVFNAGAATPVGTTLGTLTIDAAGVWTYKVDNSLPQIQALDVGTSLTESFTVTSADGTEHQINVTVNGTEDPTIISNYQPGAVTEDTAGILTDSGSLSIVDLDAGEALFNTTVTKLNNGDGQSPLGNLTIDANGNWTYTVDNSLPGVQELGDGITRDEVFQVTSIDGSVSQTIVVTITGVNGAPSIVSGESGAVTEDTAVTPSDTLVATDKLVIADEDAGENVFDAGTATPVGTTLGSLTITADGTWTYTLDNTLTAVQALDVGDKVIEEFTVTSADGTEHTIAVTINGTEDETIITGPTTDTVKEDTDVNAGLLIAGDNLSLTITDNDAGENKFSTTVTNVANDNGQLPLGTLTITEDGDWSYQVSNALQEIQSLGDGDTRVERFTVTSIDGSKTETIEVTIQGTNDLPVIDGDAVGLVIEDINVQPGDLLKDNGQLTISDVDTGEAKFQTTVTPVTVGGITPIGTLTITATGAWSYEVDNNATEVQQLGAGDTRTETFQVLSEDGTPHNVVVTINGTNDAPQNGGLSYVELTEDQATQIDANGDLNFTSQATISDVDLGEGAFVPATLTSAAGNFTDGVLTIDAAGNWTFKIPNGSANVQGLAAGERATQTFTVETDNNTTHTITVDIVGVNDGSVLISDPSESIGSVTEDDTQVTLSDSGVLELSDVDGANEEVFNTNPNTFTSTSTVEGAAADQALGTLTITANGAWNYQIPNANVEYLGQGETATETFTVLSEDGTSHTITVTIIGTNDAPVIAGTSDPDGTVVESGHEDTGGVVLGTPSIEGQIVASDIDLPDNDVLDYSVANATNPYGTATVDQNGVWKFELNNGADATQALEENETATVTFDVVVTDDQNATATQQVTITIQGTNDKPYLTSGGVFADSVKESGLNEAGDQRADGQINADDYDLADNAQLSYAFDSNDRTATSVENQYGTFTINSDGSWSFELDNTKPATQALRAGESTTVDIDAFIIDDRDAYINQTLTVTINGTNDQPTISGTNTGDVVEDRNVTRENGVRYITSEGSLRVDDVDTGESIFNTTVEPVGSPLGTLTIDALGDWDYQVNTRESAIQRLGVDETMEESFRVYSADGTSFETITITITGTNDRPRIRGNSSDSITENVEGDDSEVKATGDLNPRDADATDVHTWSVVGSSDGQYGSFSINASTGTWEYILDNDKADSLQKDELVTETFTVLVDDGNGGTRTQDVTINITGTNDALVLTGDDSATVVEDLNITEDGVIDVSDLDTKDTFEFKVLNPVGVLGDLTIDQNGKWTYTLAPDRAEHLEDNVTYPADSPFGEQIFQVSVTDGTATKVFEVSIDVIGTNDAPDIDGVRTGVLYEVNGYGQTVGADLGANDPDLNETETWQINDTNAGVGTYGTLTLNPTTGEWEYTLGVSDGQKASVDALAHDSVVTETFSVSVTDKYNAVSTKTITITVNGDNDRPVIGGTLAGEVMEDVHPNDNPANPITTSGTLTDGDVDIGDDHTWSINSTKGQYGNISIDPQTGEWVYTLNNNNPTVQGLRGVDSETLTDTFTVTVKDDSGQSDNTATQTITVTIKGTNDAPDVKGDTSGSVIEATNARSSATGALTVSDIDTTDSHTWTVENEDQVTGQASGTYGYMSVDDNGRWTYQLQSDWDATREIPPGESRVDSFEIIVTDEGGLTDTITVNITIAGTNTDPEISVQPSYTVIEDGANLSGTIIAGVPTQEQLDNNVIGGGDPDLNEVVTWSVVDGGQYGTFSIDEATGTWQYVLNNNALAVDSLDKGDTLDDTVRIRVLDKFGHESIQDITINIVGENDAPNIRGAQTRTISEDTIEAGNYTATGQLNPGDVDADDFHLWEISDSNGGRGEYGSLILSSDGQWTFTYDQPDKLDDIKSLKPGERVTDTFEVTVTDSHGATSTELVTIRIEGQNDAPTVSGDITGTYVEDNGTDDPSDDLTPITGRAILEDVDNDDFAEFVIADGQTENVYTGLYGDLSIDKDGNWQFTPKNDVMQSLNEDEVKQEVFTVIAQDQNGATITQDITISIEGRNDVPVITGESTGTVVEDGTADIYGVDLTRTDGQLVASDVDNDSSISGWSIETSGVGTYGTLTVDNNGKWTYVVDNSLPATQALISGETVQETFYVVATDNDGGISNRQEVVIDVIGQRDPGDGSGGGGIIPVDISELEVTEDGQLIDGDSYIFDVPEAASFVPINGGVYGQLVRTPDGNWQYELDNNSLLVQGLDEGETATENWRIILGPFYIDVDVTINGTADKPEITYSSDTTSPQDDTILLGEALEDVTDSISGILGVDDADLGDTHEWAVEDGQGSYGALTVDSETGEWTYVLDPSVELPAGEEVFDTFFVTVTDTDPNEDPSTASDRREVKVKIVGSAEDVVVEDKIVVETVTANEDNDDPNEIGTGDSAITITSADAGGPLALDPNLGLGDQITWTLIDGSGTYGNITVNQDGSWVFTLDNDSQAVQSLQEGQTRQDVFEVYVVDQYGKTIVDENGLPQTLEIVVNVNGQNDAPTLQANVEETIVADDPDQTISGQLSVSDVDTQDQDLHTWSATPTSVENDYGALQFNSDGSWSYVVNPNNADIIALGANESIPQTWQVTVTDPSGLTDTQMLTINIRGDNQAPTMVTQDGEVTEDDINGSGTVSVTKAIVLDDVDTNDTVTLTAADLNGTYGHFVVDPATNTWTYELYNNEPHVQALADGVKVVESFTVRATDSFGAEVTQTVEVTITGTNDRPSVAGAATGSVSDNLGSIASGKVTVADVDIGDDHTFDVKQDTDLGTFTIDNTGKWTFVVDEENEEINALAKGQTKTVQVSVIATDDSNVSATEESNEHFITITIVGTNDAPQIVDIGQQMATENINTQLSGTFDDGDVDTVNIADDHLWEVVSGDPRGDLSVDPTTGAWTFDLTGDFEYLSEGETLPAPLTYEVKVTDEHGASNTITVEFQVTGTNDAPTVVAADTVVTGTVFEDPTGAESGTSTGEVKIADVDQSDTHSYSLSGTGMVTEIVGIYGTLKLIDGDTEDTVKWEYVIDQAKVDSLNDGPVSESFDLYIESLVGGVAQGDAITQSIDITVQGRNDAAIVSPDSQTLDETNAALTLSGNLDSTDVDNPDDTFTVQTDVQGTYGKFSVQADGQWTFVANEAYDSLNVGQSVSETFQVTTIDGTPTSVTVKIEGTNDAALVSVGSVVTDETDAALTISDTLTASDVDNPDNTFTPSSEVGTYGSFAIDANGVWTFVANDSFDNLNVGEHVKETFNVTSVDGTPSTVTVQINGTNDAATISAASQELIETDSILTAGGMLTSVDPDNPDNSFIAQSSTVGTLGTFTLSASGVWTFEANSAFDNLADGVRVEEVFDVFSIDGTKSQVTIGITGSNDAATVDSADVSLQESDSALTTGGTLTATDVDNPDNTFIAQNNVTGINGTFSIDVNGVWSYIANQAFDGLNSGESVSDTFIVKSADGTESSVKVTINGTNDAATISAVDRVIAETDAVLSAGGTLTSIDPDNLDNKFLAQTNIAGAHGVFSIDEDGLWSYDADEAFDSLNVGDSVVDSFNVQSIDGTVSTVKVTIQGTNDAAVVSSADITLVESDSVLSTGGVLTATDVDNTDNQFIDQTDTQGTYGRFSIDVNGNWTFTANDALNSLAAGVVAVDTFNVKSIDGTASTVTVRIQGTNDAPVIGGTASAGVQEGVTDSATGTVTALDVDSTVTRSLRGGTLVGDVYTATGTYGTLTFNIATGIWAYVLIAGNSNALAAGDTDTDNFIIDVSDGLTSLEQPITITVTGNQGLRGDSALDDILVATSDDEWMFGNTIPADGGISSDNDSQDTFRWETANLAGTDTIKDFDVRDFTTSDPNIKHDVVDLTAVAFKDDQLLTEQLSVSEQSGNTVFEISDNGVVVQSIVLEGVALHTLLGVTPSEMSDFTPTEVLVTLYQSEQLTLPDQIKIGTDSATTETIVGTDDSDILFGGGGNDILTGGGGHDLFLFTEDAAGTTADPAEQTVTDFSVGSDILDISDLLPEHDNIGDLLGNISISVTDDPADAMDNATTVISVTNNGEQTDITLEGVGWNELGISDASVINDPGNHQTELLNQLDTMNVIKIDP